MQQSEEAEDIGYFRALSAKEFFLRWNTMVFSESSVMHPNADISKVNQNMFTLFLVSEEHGMTLNHGHI